MNGYFFATVSRFPDAHEVVVAWPHRYLSEQAAAGAIDGRTVILNLSGRPSAALDQIQLAWPLLMHGVAVLRKEGTAGGPCT